ncbi:MAG: hypothetical protein WCD80_03195 [Desulfobaccales bacterium]
MLDHHVHLQPAAAVATPQPVAPALRLEPLDRRPFSSQCLAPLKDVIASIHSSRDREESQIILRFTNGYGALISAYRLLEGFFEITPLRFHGPGPDDYEFHFRSHVPDLTWGSGCDEILRVCRQIARLRPSAAR